MSLCADIFYMVCVSAFYLGIHERLITVWEKALNLVLLLLSCVTLGEVLTFSVFSVFVCKRRIITEPTSCGVGTCAPNV